MALPHSFDAYVTKRPRKPVVLAEPHDRAGNFSIEQLAKWLQPELVEAPRKRDRVWDPWKTVALVVIASTLLWSAILFAAFRFL